MDPLPRSSMSAPACNELFSRQSNLPTNINVEHSTNIATISDRLASINYLLEIHILKQLGV
jgi:hypothetical protein